MKCMSDRIQFEFILLLLLHLLTRCSSQTNTNCYDSHQNGFNLLYPNRFPTYKTSESDTRSSSWVTQTMGRTETTLNDTAKWTCCCWEVSNQNELECRCEGEALTRVPQTLQLPLQRLTIASAGMERLRSVGLKVYGATLLDVAFINCLQLETIQNSAFSNLTLLRTIYISNAPKLTYLSKAVFEGISETIEIIRIINSGLTSVPDFGHLPPYNILQMIDLDNNQIFRIESQSIKLKTAQLVLANNDIKYIDDSAFLGSKIAKLNLRDNRKLSELHPKAFYGIQDITELDLSSTSLVRLPSAGLETVEELFITNTHTLKTIPSIYNFQNLQRAHLTHSFHCCAFQFPSRHDPQRHAQRLLELENLRKQCYNDRDVRQRQLNKQRNSMQQDETSDGPPGRWERSIPNREENLFIYASTDDPLSLGTPDAYNYLTDSTLNNAGVFHEEIKLNPEDDQLAEYCGNFTFRKPKIECYPMPNALNPCEDVMGYQWLRLAVWIVAGLAVVGNVAVLTVILSIKSDSASVPRFLMCHLAFADLCLGLYLLLIASIDAHSMGEYFNYAFDWQYGLGCKVAGFLTVFASHLSVFTLTVITIERWFTITHAMYLNKRIKLRQAAAIMLSGWIYSIFMSSLPLFGISNYSSTSICLPMEKRDIYDSVYLILILGCNFMAFTVIAICYAQIYISLGHETRHARDNIPGEISIAKKMTLLVFTNFTCWAPIAFFGLTALAGYPLINVTKSKILLVFFYPLNSCADPYLYAILTTQYRQDLIILLSKLGFCRETLMKYQHTESAPASTRYTLRGSMDRHHSLSLKGQTDLIAETQKMLRNGEEQV